MGRFACSVAPWINRRINNHSIIYHLIWKAGPPKRMIHAGPASKQGNPSATSLRRWFEKTCWIPLNGKPVTLQHTGFKYHNTVHELSMKKCHLDFHVPTICKFSTTNMYYLNNQKLSSVYYFLQILMGLS